MAREARDTRCLVLGITDPVSTRLLTGLPARLDAEGWQCHLVVGAPVDPVPGSTVHVLSMAREPSVRRDVVSLFKWVALLRALRPAAVLAGTPKAGLLAMLAAWMLRIPRRIYHLRGLRVETEEGARALLLTQLERLAMAASTEVLAVSPSLRDECVQRGLVNAEKVCVLGRGSSNGVDLSEMSPTDTAGRAQARAKLGLGRETPVIGYVGRMDRDKGLDDLVAGARGVNETTPVQLLLVGATGSEYEQEIRRALDAAGLDAFLLPWGDVRSAYQAMDVMCLPSRREGFPNVVLEAAAHGLPVVTTSATGCRDAVVPHATGWVAVLGDVADLQRCLAEAVCRPDLRAEYGAAARSMVERDYSRTHVQDLLADYLELGTTDRRQARTRTP